MEAAIAQRDSGAENDPVGTVRSLERRRIEMTRANKADALAPLLDECLIYVNSIGDAYNKADYLRAIETHELTYQQDFDVHETEYREMASLVILSGTMIGHARLDGEQQVFNSKCLSVWRHQSSDWRLVAWQSSPFVHAPRPRFEHVGRSGL
jgi:hypothetical protein